MELEELYKQIEKACKDGKLDGLLFMGSENKGGIMRMVCGDTYNVMTAIMTSMYDNKEIEEAFKMSVKNFGEFKKMMDKELKNDGKGHKENF